MSKLTDKLSGYDHFMVVGPCHEDRYSPGMHLSSEWTPGAEDQFKNCRVNGRFAHEAAYRALRARGH
jgi:hypothetical protein